MGGGGRSAKTLVGILLSSCKWILDQLASRLAQAGTKLAQAGTKLAERSRNVRGKLAASWRLSYSADEMFLLLGLSYWKQNPASLHL